MADPQRNALSAIRYGPCCGGDLLPVDRSSLSFRLDRSTGSRSTWAQDGYTSEIFSDNTIEAAGLDKLKRHELRVLELFTLRAILEAADTVSPEACVQAASEDPADGLSLQAPETVAVVIENLGEKEREAGLTLSRLRYKVESRLRSAGMGVEEDAEAVLYLNVLTVGQAFSVRLELHRKVMYLGDDGQLLSDLASLWRTGNLGAYADDASYTLHAVELSLDQFISEYLAANPKSQWGGS